MPLNKHKLSHPSKEQINAKKDIENNNEKCAPSKKYEDGSCFTLEALKKIASKYNSRNQNNQIKITNDKKHLVDELDKRLKNDCDDQICWLRQDFVKELEDEDIMENTFRPQGPKKKYEWLSTTHIDDVVNQYQHKFKDFMFLGAVPADFMDLPMLGIANLDFDNCIKKGKTKIGMVINLDKHNQSGSHWVGLFFDLEKYQIYYFDSVSTPPSKLTKKFISKIFKYMFKKKYNKDIGDYNKFVKYIKSHPNTDIAKKVNQTFDIRYNNIQHQFGDSECGVYSINFIVRMARGDGFDKVINNVTKDEEMNNCRKVYFTK